MQAIVRLRASWLRWLPRESRHYSASRATLLSARDITKAKWAKYIRTRRPLKDGTSKGTNEPLWLKTEVPKAEAVEKTNGPSLLEELFPEVAIPKTQGADRPQERDIPRLDIRSSILNSTTTPVQRANTKRSSVENWYNRAAEAAAAATTTPAPSPTHDPSTRPRVGGILMLRNASKTLVEDDFTRLIPQGTHIEGWTWAPADIVKVIPGRNTSTLERADFYFILFTTRAAMNAYRKHVMRMHNLAHRHVQSSLTSPIPLAPGYDKDGQDVDTLLQTYSLIPPSRPMQLLPLPDQDHLSPSILDIVRNMGYPDIVRGPLKEPYIVMMYLEGPQLPISAIKGIVGRSERERRLPWNRDFNHLSWHIRVPSAKNVSPLDPTMKLDRHAGPADDATDDATDDTDDVGSEVEGDERARQRAGRRERRKPRNSYLFGFDSQDAALSFVQYWHRRPFDSGGHRPETDEKPPVADVELLW